MQALEIGQQLLPSQGGPPIKVDNPWVESIIGSTRAPEGGGRSTSSSSSFRGDHQDAHPQGTATYRAALGILNHLGPDASFRRLELAFQKSQGLMTPTLQGFIQVSSSHFARLTELQMENVAVR